MFSKPIILNIDYLPVRLRLTSKQKTVSRRYSGVLLLVPDVKMDIVGYTDNIGCRGQSETFGETRQSGADYLVAMALRPNG